MPAMIEQRTDQQDQTEWDHKANNNQDDHGKNGAHVYLLFVRYDPLRISQKSKVVYRSFSANHIFRHSQYRFLNKKSKSEAFSIYCRLEP
jgi:hypothetical protein